MYRRGERKMKKLLVCLMMWMLVSVATVKIEGVNLTVPEYKGSDLFVITVGDDTESIYVLMKDGIPQEIRVLTDEEVKKFFKEPAVYNEKEI